MLGIRRPGSRSEDQVIGGRAVQRGQHMMSASKGTSCRHTTAGAGPTRAHQIQIEEPDKARCGAPDIVARGLEDASHTRSSATDMSLSRAWRAPARRAPDRAHRREANALTSGVTKPFMSRASAQEEGERRRAELAKSVDALIVIPTIDRRSGGNT